MKYALNVLADEPKGFQMIVMREEIQGLTIVQSIVLPEKSTSIIATFAIFKENLLCAIDGFGSIYELQAAKESSETPYIEPPRAHAMPANVRAICSLEIDGDWRLAASLQDNTVALFGMKSEQLTLLTRLEKTDSLYLARIPTTNAILSIVLPLAKQKWCKSIELYVPDQNGQFRAPRTILPAEKGLWFFTHFVFRNSIDGRLYAAIFDISTESLHLFDFC